MSKVYLMWKEDEDNFDMHRAEKIRVFQRLSVNVWHKITHWKIKLHENKGVRARILNKCNYTGLKDKSYKVLSIFTLMLKLVGGEVACRKVGGSSKPWHLGALFVRFLVGVSQHSFINWCVSPGSNSAKQKWLNEFPLHISKPQALLTPIY